MTGNMHLIIDFNEFKKNFISQSRRLDFTYFYRNILEKKAVYCF